MSRKYLFAASALLLAAAAVVHFWGRLGEAPASTVTETTNPNAPDGNSTAAVPQTGLVPPLDLNLGVPADPNALPDVSVSPVKIIGPDGKYTTIRMTGAINYGEFAHGKRAFFDGHRGKVCASGCSYDQSPMKRLTSEEYHSLINQYAVQPMDGTSLALETLLHYGRQTRLMIAHEGTAPLDPARDQFLRNELRKTHVYVEIKLEDEYGNIRGSLPPTIVPLDRRHAFDVEMHDVQPIEESTGTVKRVGLDYLWTRL
jgi:hypothetical protein